ncbi:MAG: peroxiredoxin family protein [Actinomycetota bacterium]|jgi:thiol-disulfide isomerase/thioredoxin|nr:peroxiredoxin family protein [Actinomycetota bacterium]
MKRLIVVFLLVLVAAGFYRSFGSAETGTGTLTLAQPAPTVGQRAPQFTAETAEGDTFTLSDEGVYVLTFWSTLNENSNDAQPGFEQLAGEYNDDGVSFAAVYVNSIPRDRDVPYTMLQDPIGKLTSLYNVKRVPRLFLVKDGEITLVQNDYYEEYKGELEEALKSTLEERS